MITSDQITTIGKFNKPHGINGEVSATILAPRAVLEGCSCIICDIDGIFVPFFINSIRNKSQETVLLTIDGIGNENEAAMIVNKDIYVLRSEYSHIAHDQEELPVDFFTGFDVIINDKLRGKISDIDDATANVLFVIEISDGSQTLIPAVEDFIIGIDIDNRLIELEVPVELLSL